MKKSTLLFVFIFVLTVITLPFGVVYAGGAEEDGNGNEPVIQDIQENTSVGDIMEKIDSMTSTPQQPASLMSPTYAPEDNTVDSGDISSTPSDSEAMIFPAKSVKAYMHPFKVLLILFAADLVLIFIYFMYLYQRPGRSR